MKVFVAAGTHRQNFDRLISAALEIADLHPQWDLRFQVGPNSGVPDIYEKYDVLTYQAFQDQISWADIVLSQPSPGIARNVLQADCTWFVLPRNANLGEHVDNHQEHFAEWLIARGLARALVVEEIEQTHDTRQAGHDLRSTERAFAAAVRSVIECGVQ